MSYFCANSISFDKKEKKCKVKGGDNNVVPRSNYWSRYFPIQELIRDLSGGMIQFTSRTDKNISVENLAYKYDDKIFKLTGLSAYDALDLTDESQEKLEKYKKFPADHWNREVVDKSIAILKDPKMLSEIASLKEQFVDEIINLKIDKSKYIIRNIKHNAYVSKTFKASLQMCYNISFAKFFTMVKANDLLKRYDKEDYEIIPA